MDNRLMHVLGNIEKQHATEISRGSRLYMEVNIGQEARRLGYADLERRFLHTAAIVPLKAPQSGMKVRIDGRTFINYAEYPSGIAVPGHVARKAGGSFVNFIAQDSMICNYC